MQPWLSRPFQSLLPLFHCTKLLMICMNQNERNDETSFLYHDKFCMKAPSDVEPNSNLEWPIIFK